LSPGNGYKKAALERIGTRTGCYSGGKEKHAAGDPT